MRSYWIWVSPNPMASVPCLVRENRCTDRHKGKMPCEDKSRDWSVAAASRRMPRIAGNYPKLGARHKTRLPQNTPERTNLAKVWFGLLISRTARE